MSKGLHIHPTAMVHPKAQLGCNVTIGPYAEVGEEVVLGDRCSVGSHAILKGIVQVGNDTQIYPFSTLGFEPQHLKYRGEPTCVKIGERVTIREYVSIHRGTVLDKGITEVGDDTILMAYCHLGHDCSVGRKVILANTVQIAGHVQIGDHTVIGGMTGIVQFVRVGRYCYIGGGSILRKDVVPFVLAKGDPLEVQGINSVGLKRAGFSAEAIERLEAIFRTLFLRKLPLQKALTLLQEELGRSDEVQCFLSFLQNSKLGYAR